MSVVVGVFLDKLSYEPYQLSPLLIPMPGHFIPSQAVLYSQQKPIDTDVHSTVYEVVLPRKLVLIVVISD